MIKFWPANFLELFDVCKFLFHFVHVMARDEIVLLATIENDGAGHFGQVINRRDGCPINFHIPSLLIVILTKVPRLPKLEEVKQGFHGGTAECVPHNFSRHVLSKVNNFMRMGSRFKV